MNRPSRAILLLSCPDRRGIVADVSHFIFANNGNILRSDQHHDPETRHFFMRVEWDISEFRLGEADVGAAFEPIAAKFAMDWKLEFSSRRTRMAIFVSKFDHCLYDLLLRSKEGEIDADVALIVSNHRDLEPVAGYFGLPFHHYPVGLGSDKHGLEALQIGLMERHSIDLIVLARYMQILSSSFVSRYRHRIINIHHSFLPAFVGARPYHQAFARGVKIIGATSHYVTEDLDQGPIIEQDVVRISHRDAVPDLVRKGRDLEKLVLSKAVKLHLEHRVLVFGNKTVVFD